jgi:hypothetical protein
MEKGRYAYIYKVIYSATNTGLASKHKNKKFLSFWILIKVSFLRYEFVRRQIEKSLPLFFFSRNNTHTGKSKYRQCSKYLGLFFHIVNTPVEAVVTSHH